MWYACSDWGRLSTPTWRYGPAAGGPGCCCGTWWSERARQGRAGTVQRGTQDSELARGTSKHTNKHKGTKKKLNKNFKSGSRLDLQPKFFKFLIFRVYISSSYWVLPKMAGLSKEYLKSLGIFAEELRHISTTTLEFLRQVRPPSQIHFRARAAFCLNLGAYLRRAAVKTYTSLILLLPYFFVPRLTRAMNPFLLLTR
jgi:hypothetical protein